MRLRCVVSTSFGGCAIAAAVLAVLSVHAGAQDFGAPPRPPGAVPKGRTAAPPRLHAPRTVAASVPPVAAPQARFSSAAAGVETTGSIPSGRHFDRVPAGRPQADLALSHAEPTGAVAGLPHDEQPETGHAQLDPRLRPQVVAFPTHEPLGTIVIDTPNTYLYLVLGDGRAIRYGVGVGRDGFTWSGAQIIKRAAEWPDWRPPPEMIQRQPYLPRFMAGGPTNPLGARALYLGDTVYRIHGTNQPSTIGTFVSSGCIRLINEDIIDLYSRVGVGTRVVVLPGNVTTIEALLQRR
jgi:lipoprotein-anchoring transpeptidase ErfK/SrfK